ncbi:MAG: hypothetical protein M3406_07310 [Chloroflexota bacterium]|nr:hypothetical protein [Chloroflexota bacterium]
MTTLVQTGGAAQGATHDARSREKRGRDTYAARPPSERHRAPEERPGVGLFRFAGCGLGLTIALVLTVGVVTLIGYLRDDPGRNPAPAAYRTAVCAAFEELSEGTRALERGVDVDDAAEREMAARAVERHVAAANDALTDLPVWEPGRSLDELLGSQIITLTNGATSLADGGAAQDLAIALEIEAGGREQLSSGRYGFDCS